MSNLTTSSCIQQLFLYKVIKNLILLSVLTSTLSSCNAPLDMEKKPVVIETKKNSTISSSVPDKNLEEKTLTNTPVPEIKNNQSTEKRPSSDKIEKKLIDKKQKEFADKFLPIKLDLSNLRIRLLGWDEYGIMELLGFPSFKRSEPPAIIWQYRSQVCILNVFLYKKGEELNTKYIAFRGRIQDSVEDETCFKSILIMNTAN